MLRGSAFLVLTSFLSIGTLGAPAWAQSDGVELCDGAGTVVSKAVGAEQWSIQYDLLSNTANGIAYDPGTGAVTFVSCLRTGASADAYTYACSAPAADDPERWDTFATGVSLDPSFFRLDGFINADLHALSRSSIRVAYADFSDRVSSFGGYSQWDMEDAVDADGVLRGRNPDNGNPVTLQATFTADRPGFGPVNFFAIEYAEDECNNVFFNVREDPAESGRAETGTVAGFYLSTGRNEDGTCDAPDDDDDVAGLAGVIRLQFDF